VANGAATGAVEDQLETPALIDVDVDGAKLVSVPNPVIMEADSETNPELP
jgi:hypothetical protein